MASQDPPTVIASLRYEPADRTRLERWARRIVPGELRKSGRSESRQLAYLAGRAALALALDRLGASGSVVADPQFGFLRFLPASGMDPAFVTVSHSANSAVAAVSPGGIGLDTEAVTRDASRVYTRVATARELAALPAFCARTGLPPICLWSAKEAFSKATGLGIKFGLHDFQIHLEGLPPCRGETRLRGPLPIADPSLLWEIDAGFVIAVCAERPWLGRGIGWVRSEGRNLPDF
jgi:4'-phosphopantetheinyl transferase EntD